MVGFEHSRGGRNRSNSRGSFSRRDGQGRGSFGGMSPRRRDFGRESNGPSRNRRDVQMTKVICSSCGVECEVPFKPTSNKPVYCSNCFEKKGGGSSNDLSNKEFEKINEKLDKIIKALEIK